MTKPPAPSAAGAAGWPGSGLQIGELAARCGVSTHVLRAWERRYGLISPMRTVSGYRLYGPADERRVREMVRLRGLGVTAQRAARHVLGAERVDVSTTPGGAEQGDVAPGDYDADGPAEGAPGLVIGASDRHSPPVLRRLAGAEHLHALIEALQRFDESTAQAALDAAFLELSVEGTITQVLMPCLAAIGAGWATGEVDIAQEHFASQLIRARLTAFAMTWGVGSGPVALLACAPEERHDLGLLAFGVALGRTGWRILYLGAETPWLEMVTAAERVEPELVVVASVLPERLAGLSDHVAALSRHGRVALAGAGAAHGGAELLPPGVLLLDGDPVQVAASLSRR